MHALANLFRHFPSLTSTQREQLERLPDLYREWNSKINVISRKDIENIVPNHVLHSLSIGKFIQFKPSTVVFDIGTGGGFPGIPLAILYPECNFVLIDSIHKKIRVVYEISMAIGLKNVTPVCSRAEEIKQKCHFVVSRAAMSMEQLVKISRKHIDKKTQFNSLPNGVIALKGGELSSELAPFRKLVTVESVEDYLDDPIYSTKKIIYLPL